MSTRAMKVGGARIGGAISKHRLTSSCSLSQTHSSAAYAGYLGLKWLAGLMGGAAMYVFRVVGRPCRRVTDSVPQNIIGTA
jgi:hypothetical protein